MAQTNLATTSVKLSTKHLGAMTMDDDAERARADAAAAHERAAIVAWMRDVGPHWDAKTIISAIIRGDHRSGGNTEATIYAAKSNEVK
jgi:uncharacterized membrane protein